MDTHQLLDALAAHIALYSSSSSFSSSSSSSPSTSRRNSILRWFSSLSVPQRQSSLTVVDHKFLQVLLRMQNRLNTNGHGFFILLPDMPSGSLPTLCFRRSRGLPSRSSAANASERSISECLRLFSSTEDVLLSAECSSLDELDACTVSEEFVNEVDRFVAVMDRVSDGGFLIGDEKDLSSEWLEFAWLKAKGYYSLEAFAANRLELALRLSWMNAHGLKKRGSRPKEKAAGTAAVAANVFYRNKGHMDWWEGLDPGLRKKTFLAFLGKATGSLACKIFKGANDASRNEASSFCVGTDPHVRYGSIAGRKRCGLDSILGILPAPVIGELSRIVNYLGRLLMLQDVSAMISACQQSKPETEKLFFSTLRSVHTISDCILRRFQAVLVVVSTSYLQFELLEDKTLKAPMNKSKQKRKHKSQSVKKHDSAPKSLQQQKLPGDIFGSDNQVNVSSEAQSLQNALSEMPISITLQANKAHQEPILASGPDLSRGAIDVKNTARKTGKGKNKRHKLQSKAIELEKPAQHVTEASSAGVSYNGLSGGLLDASTPYCHTTELSNLEDVLPDCDAPIIATNEPSILKSSTSGTLQCNSLGSSSPLGPSSSENNANQEDRVVPHSGGNISADEGIGNLNPGVNDSYICSGIKFVEGVVNGAHALIQKKDVKDYYAHRVPCPLGGVSYEWPSLTPLYFPSANLPHIPAATDRLHLDVGRNWNKHFHQSFISARNQARNALLEPGFGRILPSPTLPMSLDWPLSLNSSDIRTGQDLADNVESVHWTAEEEPEVHGFSGRDYNQLFGGGIMYWNTSDHVGTGFSRPTSLSSEDSSWAWHEADLNRAIDDMVGLPASYSANGLTSPTSTSFSSPFDTIGPTHQHIGFVMAGNDITGKDIALEDKVSGPVSGSTSGILEGLTGDSHPYPMLRPIIVSNIARKGSGSEFMLNLDHKSPCLPRSREMPRIKRPPSPIVLCVPQAPAPPPPSPVGESRKQRGFPAVRSGSSSPRNWGLRNRDHDGNGEEAHICMDGPEVIWPSWRNKGLGSTQVIQSLSGSILQDHLIALSQLALDKEHSDVALPLQPSDTQNCSARKASLSVMHNILQYEIDSFCKQVANESLIKKPYINWAIKRVARCLQVLWPRSRTSIFGSIATGLALPTSDVDLVVRLPPVRNLEPIKEAGILEGRNGIKETCLQHAARYLSNQEWVRSDSLKTIENTAIPVIMLVAEVPGDLVSSNGGSSIGHVSDVEFKRAIREQNFVPLSGVVSADISHLASETKLKMRGDKDVKSVHLDISFKSPSHTGLQTTELVRELTEQFPASVPLALVLKQFLADRSLDRSYSGGLSSYCLVLLIIRFLQHQHHVGCAINQNLGSLLMDFLYFFGNVFDPRQMRISIRGTGSYLTREREHCIDPIHIDDPLYPANNVGRNCFRIHQCIKAFADAYAILENELSSLPPDGDEPSSTTDETSFRLLSKIIPSVATARKS